MKRRGMSRGERAARKLRVAMWKWTEREGGQEGEEEKAENLAEKMMGGCGLYWCRGTTGKGKEYCPECKRQKEEERRRTERAGEQSTNK